MSPTSEIARLNSGYFPDFKSGPKVVFWGDKTAVGQLAAFLRRAHAAESLPFVVAVDGKPISISVESTARGVERTDSGCQWKLNAETMLLFADLLEPLVTSGTPGHQYLDCGRAKSE